MIGSVKRIIYITLISVGCLFLLNRIRNNNLSDADYYFDKYTATHVYPYNYIPFVGNKFFGKNKIDDLTGHDIEIYKYSKMWQVALAVYEQDTELIHELVLKDPTLINDTTNHQRMTLLEWSVYNGRYLSAELLLKLGASINYNGSPLSYACTISETPMFINLLLKYGADPNMPDKYGGVPLQSSSLRNLEYLQILVKAGANPSEGVNSACLNSIELCKYLIVDCKGDCEQPFTASDSTGVTEIYAYPIDVIRDMSFGPEKYLERIKMKRALIDYINTHSKRQRKYGRIMQ